MHNPLAMEINYKYVRQFPHENIGHLEASDNDAIVLGLQHCSYKTAKEQNLFIHKLNT